MTNSPFRLVPVLTQVCVQGEAIAATILARFRFAVMMKRLERAVVPGASIVSVPTEVSVFHKYSDCFHNRYTMQKSTHLSSALNHPAHPTHPHAVVRQNPTRLIMGYSKQFAKFGLSHENT